MNAKEARRQSEQNRNDIINELYSQIKYAIEEAVRQGKTFVYVDSQKYHYDYDDIEDLKDYYLNIGKRVSEILINNEYRCSYSIEYDIHACYVRLYISW